LYGAAGLTAGAEGAAVAAKEFERLNDDPFGVPATVDSQAVEESIQLNITHIFTDKHGWEGGASTANVDFIKQKAAEFGWQVKPGQFFSQWHENGGDPFYLGLWRDGLGTLHVEDAYFRWK
jgi:hypothetical protein